MNPSHIVRVGYDKVSYEYRRDEDSEVCVKYEAWIGRLVADLVPQPRILDLGCGCGIPVSQVLAYHARVTGVDISPVQIERARKLVPEAKFVCEDMVNLRFPPGWFNAVVAFYSIIHVPLNEQQALLGRISTWLGPGGLLIATLGSGAWTGIERDWLGVKGAEMYWSHADATTYRTWLTEAGFEVLHEELILQGMGSIGHQLFYAKRAASL